MHCFFKVVLFPGKLFLLGTHINLYKASNMELFQDIQWYLSLRLQIIPHSAQWEGCIDYSRIQDLKTTRKTTMTLGIKCRIFSFLIHNNTTVVKMGGSWQLYCFWLAFFKEGNAEIEFYLNSLILPEPFIGSFIYITIAYNTNDYFIRLFLILNKLYIKNAETTIVQ